VIKTERIEVTPPVATAALSSIVRPLRGRSATLPPNPLHRELLEKERVRYEAARESDLESPWTQMHMTDLDLVDLHSMEDIELVSETFELSVDWAAEAARAHEDASSSQTVEEWRPGDHESPTDIFEPIHIVLGPEVVSAQTLGPVTHEITELIRERSVSR
jgi:hypothetical protein